MNIVKAVQVIRRGLKGTAVLAIAIIGIGIGLSHAAAACTGDICIEQAWTRATPGAAQEAALYFSISNNGATDEKLVRVSTTAASGAMIHQTTVKDRIVQMLMVGEVTIPPHGRVLFSPGGYHVMLTGLKAPLKEGTSVSAKLTFASGRTIEVNIPVLKTTAIGPASAEPPSNRHSRP